MILEFGAGEEGFEAYTQRQFMTESTNINSLADHHIWSTIKTLPATLPEPWAVIRGPGSRHIGPWSTDLEPWVVGRIPRFKLRGSRLVDAGSGVTGASCSI